MTASLSDQLDRLNQSQLDTITFLSGFDANLNVATATFNTYFGTTAITAQTALQQGATIAFSFDPAAGFTAQEQIYAAQSLALWSGMCNLNFTYTADTNAATVVFAKAGTTFDGQALPAGTYEAPLTSSPTDNPDLNQLTRALIVLDTSGGYGDFGSYTTYAGYGIDAMVHEVGHLVGLGHAGPYNGSVNASVDQNNSTDVRSWSVMSYIRPTDGSARYFADYDPAGIDFGTGDGIYRAPYTPMGLDIFAAQRLLGAPTSTMFAGGQTFGFHSNVTYTALDGSEQLLSMYDFTVDKAPVVTLFDTGAGNTLDISGFAAAASVDLHDGTFSSVAGLAGNIFIEYGTRIDALVGGKGADTVVANDDADTISGGGGADTVLGGAGADSILGGSGDDSLSGGGGGDTINGGNGADIMAGGEGDDSYFVTGADDSIVELAAGGLDTVHATIAFVLPAEVERLVLAGTSAIDGTGNALDNRLQGNSAANLLQGDDGNDTLLGGGGGDTLLGGTGTDVLNGGDGADHFRFLDPADGRDRIADFVPGLDLIEVSALGFGGGLTEGMDLAAAGKFVVGAKATLPGGQFIYSSANGVLSWDADGTGAGARVQIAVLTGAPVLTAGDVHVLL